jgi:hypothetical protein
MKTKISITVDVKKLDKSRMVERTYKNKEGADVTVKDLKLDIIPLKEPRFVTEGAGWKLMKVAFITETPTQEEREAKTKMNIVGDGVQFEYSDAPTPTFNKDSQGKAIKGQEEDFDIGF